MNVDMTPKTLKEIINIISEFGSDAKLSFDHNGLSVKMVDPAHVAMCSLTMDKAVFSNYSVEDNNENVCVDVDRIKKILPLLACQETVNVSTKSNRLIFKFGNMKRTMPLIDPGAISDPKIPNLILNQEVTIKSDNIKQIMKCSDDIEQAVCVVLTPKDFSLTASSDSDEIEYKITKDECVKHACNEASRGKYPTDYIIKSLKGATNQDIKISMKTDYPVKIEYLLDGGHVMFLIAPRIETE
jgi:proliferating cell nuclear antigen